MESAHTSDRNTPSQNARAPRPIEALLRSSDELQRAERYALSKAYRMGLQDPAFSAGEAVGHLAVESCRGTFNALPDQPEQQQAIFAAWSRRVMLNKLLQIRRLERGGKVMLAGETLEAFCGSTEEEASSSPEGAVQARQRRELALSRILQLRPRQRTLLLAHLAGFSREQLAAYLQSADSQTVLLARVRSKLKMARGTTRRPVDGTLRAQVSAGGLEAVEGNALLPPLWKLAGEADQLLEALFALSEPGRTLLLCWMADFDIEAIAQATGLEPSTVRSQLRQASAQVWARLQRV